MRDHDRIDGRDGARAPGGCSQQGRLPGESFADTANLAGPQQAVDLKVAASVAGERLDKNGRRHLGRPEAAPPQFCQACLVARKAAEPAGIENESHAAPGSEPATLARSANWSAHSRAATMSFSLGGPDSILS